jgi:D-alanyl-lipoteichoic acid acyltransferase DltB (MBOAT superfamily)
LVASYVFYGYWNWKFLFLLGISTVVDFSVGKALYATQNPKKRNILLGISLVSNLSILFFFKYFNFFADSFANMLNMVGLRADPITLNVILPVGISFYTFQTLSYTIDIYRRQLQPTNNFLDFALFVAFFPQLVAGPIERAATLLPQISSKRQIQIDQINAGLFLILWGFFKKIVVADNMGKIADQIFNNYTEYQGLDIAIAILAFTFQIYGDFSGYSDIARGTSKLMGFELMVNFKLPYFALNPSDFWRRWHISLSTWLRDYLYIPLGGNRYGTVRTYCNLFIVMLLGGLWHGAAWNFVIWGAFHGTILILYRMFDRHQKYLDTAEGKHLYPQVMLKMMIMFVLTCIGWVIFRSRSVEQIMYIFMHVGWQISPQTSEFAYQLLFFIVPLLLVQFYQYFSGDLLVLTKLKFWSRVPVYGLLAIGMFLFSVREATEFLYFQF